MRVFRQDDNYMTGIIPESLLKCSMLEQAGNTLDIFNLASYMLPIVFVFILFMWHVLSFLEFSGNLFSGSIPHIADLDTVKLFHANDNLLTGPFPTLLRHTMLYLEIGKKFRVGVRLLMPPVLMSHDPALTSCYIDR